MYVISATVKVKTEDGYSKIIQIPTFFLDENIQGIVDREHARKIAAQVINPTNDPNCTVSIGLSKV